MTALLCGSCGEFDAEVMLDLSGWVVACNSCGAESRICKNRESAIAHWKALAGSSEVSAIREE